jgi:hypothetical protein
MSFVEIGFLSFFYELDFDSQEVRGCRGADKVSGGGKRRLVTRDQAWEATRRSDRILVSPIQIKHALWLKKRVHFISF